jgi:hypothetical protein
LYVVAQIMFNFHRAGKPIALPGVPDDLAFDPQVEDCGVKTIMPCQSVANEHGCPEKDQPQ